MENAKHLVSEAVQAYGKGRGALKPILQYVVEKYNYLPEDAMVEIGQQLNLSPAQVYGTASFYSFLDTEKRGKYVIRVCKSIVADMKGKREIIRTLESLLNVKVGETSVDGIFTLMETNDIGWSDREPSMLINDIPYTDLTSEKVVNIINEYRNK